MFRTELTIAPATGQLPRTARVLTVGSCFADSIGSRLIANKVEALVNPFGTVFQPLALARLLRAAAGEEVDWQQHLVEARGRWQSYDLHGSIGADSPVELLQTIQELVRRTGEFLRQADVVLLTLGTAWAYRLRETGELVNNCHKQSADLFVRELLTPDEIINGLAETHAYLRRINPELRFVLTVSPVRHLKDTLQLNSVSKSVLRLATHIVSDLLPGVAYFPAYELLVDDLRDYRFYAADMLHPSEVAEDYVWEKFTRAYFDADFGRFRKEWAGVRQSLGHRPLHAGAPEHRQFLESTREKLEQLSLRKVDVASELQTVRTQLAALPVPRLPEPVAAVEDEEERIDIGEGAGTGLAAAEPQALPVAAAPTDGRPPRLSPEEFRAQRAARSGQPERGRRDGRGKGQQVQPTETEQFQNAANDQTALPSAVAEPGLASAEQPLQPTELATALLALDADAGSVGEEGVKKKKRRSRGGAKRTARKNALRLAAEGGLPTVESGEEAENASGTTTADATDGTHEVPVTPKKSSVITKSVPVKRGGRRDEPGRVPRVPLFAASPTPADAGATDSVTDAVPLPTASVSEVESGGQADVLPAEPMPRENSRNNRNNRNRPSADTAASESIATAETARAVAVTEEVSRASAETTDLPQAEATVTSGNARPAQTARQPRRKARAVSAARAEKPAIDTPVVPVPDATIVRTQVAAGRLMGSSASLVVPVALPKKAATTTKRVGAATKSKAKPEPTASAAQAIAAPVIAAVVEAPVVQPKAAAKPKAPAKPVAAKPSAAKAPKAKTVATATATPVAAAEPEANTAPVAPKKAGAKAAVVAKVATPKAAVVKATPKDATPKATAAKAVAPKASTPKAAVAKAKAPAKKAPAKPPAKPAAKPKPPKKPNKSA